MRTGGFLNSEETLRQEGKNHLCSFGWLLVLFQAAYSTLNRKKKDDELRLWRLPFPESI